MPARRAPHPLRGLARHVLLAPQSSGETTRTCRQSGELSTRSSAFTLADGSNRSNGIIANAANCLVTFRYSEMQEAIGSVDQCECDQGDKHFTDGSHSERPPSLLAEFLKTGAQPNTRKRQQKCPAGEICEARQLHLGKESDSSQQRDQQKPQHKFGKLPPEELRLVAYRLGLA